MTDKKFVVLMLGAIVVILVVSYLFVSQGNKPQEQVKIASYQISDAQKPQAKIENSAVDLGKIKVSDEKAQDFKVVNSGQKSLQLSNISSSCGCTVGQIIIDGEISDEFGMHSQSDEIFEVAPGKSAVVRVTYRPYVMPVSGFVEREVYITTNDPANSKLVFKVTANVQ